MVLKRKCKDCGRLYIGEACQWCGIKRSARLAEVWQRTCPDYRTMLGGKIPYILVYRESVGTCLVPLSSLTEAEIARRLGEAKELRT